MSNKLYLTNTPAVTESTRVVKPRILYKKNIPTEANVDYEGIMDTIHTDENIENREFKQPQYMLPSDNIYEGYQDSTENIAARINNLVKTLGTEGVDISPEQQGRMIDVAKSVPYYANRISSDFGVDDKKWFEDTLFGILGVETNVGRLAAMTPEENPLKKRVGQLLFGIEPNEMSLGIGRTKTESIPKYVRDYIQVNSYKDLVSKDKSIAAAASILAHNYNIIKEYSKQFPELQMTEDDIKNLSILAYNQGLDKILNIGKLNDRKFYDEELQSFRDLYSGKTNDVSSTWAKYLPPVLQKVVKSEPMVTYIQKTKNYRKALLGNE